MWGPFGLKWVICRGNGHWKTQHQTLVAASWDPEDQSEMLGFAQEPTVSAYRWVVWTQAMWPHISSGWPTTGQGRFSLDMNQQFRAPAFLLEEIGTVEENLLKMEVGRETQGSQSGKFSLWRAREPEARPGTKEGQGLLKKEKRWRHRWWLWELRLQLELIIDWLFKAVSCDQTQSLF